MAVEGEVDYEDDSSNDDDDDMQDFEKITHSEKSSAGFVVLLLLCLKETSNSLKTQVFMVCSNLCENKS